MTKKLKFHVGNVATFLKLGYCNGYSNNWDWGDGYGWGDGGGYGFNNGCDVGYGANKYGKSYAEGWGDGDGHGYYKYKDRRLVGDNEGT